MNSLSTAVEVAIMIFSMIYNYCLPYISVYIYIHFILHVGEFRVKTDDVRGKKLLLKEVFPAR